MGRRGVVAGVVALAAGCADNPAFLLASATGAGGPTTGDATTMREPTATDADPTSTTDADPTTTAPTTTGATTTTTDVTSDGSSTAAASPCGDGDLDDAEQCDDANVAAGDGCEANCRFLFADPIFFEFGPGDYRDLEAGHFNDDDLLDLVAARNNGPGAPVLHNEGGNFVPGGEFPLAFFPWVVHAAPLAANKGDDLVAASLLGSKVFIKHQNGGGDYDGLLDVVDVPGGLAGGVQLGDVDGDGRLDIAVPAQQTKQVAVALGEEGGGFAAPSYHDIGESFFRFKLAALDADPEADLVAVQNDNDINYFVLAYNFYGPQPAVVRIDSASGSFSDIAVIDIGEPDAIPEIVVSDYELAQVRLYQQVMDVYQEAATIAVAGSPSELVGVALRGGGSPDVITLNALSGTVSVVSTIGGVFQTPSLKLQAFEPGIYNLGMTVADLDGDGFHDIAVIEPAGRVAVFRNQSGD
jgi:cysteine-rich repeat protein